MHFIVSPDANVVWAKTVFVFASRNSISVIHWLVGFLRIPATTTSTATRPAVAASASATPTARPKARFFRNTANRISRGEGLLGKVYEGSRNLGDNLLEKTKKLLEGKKLRNKKRELNNIDLKSQENKILLRLQKNLREKNNDYNMNIIKPKIKYWKP